MAVQHVVDGGQRTGLIRAQRPVSVERLPGNITRGRRQISRRIFFQQPYQTGDEPLPGTIDLLWLGDQPLTIRVWVGRPCLPRRGQQKQEPPALNVPAKAPNASG